MNDALNDAFGGDDKSFTETMTDIARAVGASFSSGSTRKNETVEVTPPDRLAHNFGPGTAQTSLLGTTKFRAAAAVAVLAVIAVGWWMFGGTNDAIPVEEPLAGTPRISEVDPVFDAPQVEANSEVNDMLEEARLATAAGQIFNPPGSNAIELYLAAAKLAPDNAVIAAEFDAVIEQALGLAEASLLARRPQDTSAALQRVAMADPQNARLPFLNAQLVQMQLRDFLDSARLAIREGRYEDATVALSGARRLGTEDSDEIQLVEDELNDARSAQRVDEVLAKANSRLEDGKLTSPSNDNARYYFELALSNDPANTAAHQGLSMVAGKLVLQARTEIDAGNFEAADFLLADARRLDPSSAELASVETVLHTARDRQELERIAAEQKAAADRAASEKAAAERRAAEQAAAQRRAAEQAAAAAAAELSAKEASGAVPSGQESAAAANGEPTQIAANTAVPDAEAGGLPDTSSSTPESTSQAPAPNASPVAASTLTRTKYIAPKYPRAAERRGISGWVDLVFTVDIDGTVVDVSVRASNPGVTFVNSAVSAVEGWEFEPVVENGVAVQKRAAVRMMFAVE